MRQKSYKDQIKFLTHIHRDAIEEMSRPSFFYFNNDWPAFVMETCEYYQHPVRKVLDDLISYRNSFRFQKDRAYMTALLATEGAAA